MKILLATKNRGKVIEMRPLMASSSRSHVDLLDLPGMPNVAEPRETGKTFAENARIKALHYAGAHRILCIADDSGLAVEALNGEPGVHSARYAGPDATDEKNVERLLANLRPHPRPWKAAFVCVTVAALPGRVLAETTGRIDGEIIPAPSGMGGFGYDPVFVVEGMGKTMAALSVEEKNRISHRGQSVRKLIEELSDQGILG